MLYRKIIAVVGNLLGRCWLVSSVERDDSEVRGCLTIEIPTFLVRSSASKRHIKACIAVVDRCRLPMPWCLGSIANETKDWKSGRCSKSAKTSMLNQNHHSLDVRDKIEC